MKPGSPESQAPPVVDAALGTGSPQFYANGFTIGMTNADTFLVLQMFGKPVAVVSLSYTLAKTLAQRLNGLVSYWEKKTGKEIQTTDNLDQAFKEGTNAPVRNESDDPQN